MAERKPRPYKPTGTPLDIDCDTCKTYKPGGVQGKKCKRPSGHNVFGGAFHDTRVKAWKKQQDEASMAQLVARFTELRETRGLELHDVVRVEVPELGQHYGEIDLMNLDGTVVVKTVVGRVTVPFSELVALEAPEQFTVHCFFRSCHDYSVTGPTPEAAHATMEAHYREVHRQILGQMTTPAIEALVRGDDPAMVGRKSFTISDGAADVLRNVEYVTTAKGEGVRLPAQLDRKLYEEVNACLVRAGVAWNKGMKAHMAVGATQAESIRRVIETIVGTGKAPDANPNSFFATPRNVYTDYIQPHLELDDIPEGGVILEPSCGDGRLLRWCAETLLHMRTATNNKAVSFWGWELDHDRYLAASGDFSHIVFGDFLDAEPDTEEMVDRIVMNPPFSSPGHAQLWLEHVQAAVRWLAPQGILVAIVPAGFSFAENRAVSEFRAFVTACGGWEKLPDEAFKLSGTNVSTCVLWMERRS